MLGRVLEATHQYQQAITTYDRIIQRQPDFCEAWIRRGQTFEALQRYSEAFASYGVALELQPNHPEAIARRNGLMVKLKAGNGA
jgi:superkiller protein 3